MSLQTKAVWVLSLLFFSAAFAGCTKVTSTSRANYAFYAYVMNRTGTANVMPFTVDPTTGAIGALSSPVSAPMSTNYAITGDKRGRFLYVVSGDGTDNGELIAYTIDARTGALNQINSPLIIQGEGRPSAMVLHPNEKMLYVSGTMTNQLYLFKVEENGALVAYSTLPVSGNTNSAGLALDSTGNYLYVADSAAAAISYCRIDRNNGNLDTGFSTITPPATVRNIAIDPTNRYLYAYDNANIYGFLLVAGNGSLASTSASIGPTALTTSTVLNTISFSPTGGALFAAGTTPGATESFLIGNGGSLLSNATLAGTPTVPVFDTIDKIAIAVDGQSPGTVSVLTLNSVDATLHGLGQPVGSQGGAPNAVWIARPLR